MGNAATLSFREAVELRVGARDLPVLIEGGLLPVMELCERWGTRSTKLANYLENIFQECIAEGLVRQISRQLCEVGEAPAAADEQAKGGVMGVIKGVKAFLGKLKGGVKTWADGIAGDWATWAKANKMKEDDPQGSLLSLYDAAKAKVDEAAKKAGADPNSALYKLGQKMSGWVATILLVAGKGVAKAAALAWKAWGAFWKDPAGNLAMATALGVFGGATVMFASAGIVPAAIMTAIAGAMSATLIKGREGMKSTAPVGATAAARQAGGNRQGGDRAADAAAYRYQARTARA